MAGGAAPGSAGAGERHFGGEAGGARGGLREEHLSGAGGAAGRGEGRFAGRAGGRFDEHGVAMRSEHGFYNYHGQQFHRFAGDYYRYPHGYGYRHWDVGYRFPREYWINDYYIDDFAAYSLEPPPFGFQWVRYGPDILLFNLETGEIAQGVYGAFGE